MAINYPELIDKLGNKLNTLGEAAFKVGITGVKYEALGIVVSISIGLAVSSYIFLKNYNKLHAKNLTYDERDNCPNAR